MKISSAVSVSMPRLTESLLRRFPHLASSLSGPVSDDTKALADVAIDDQCSLHAFQDFLHLQFVIQLKIPSYDLANIVVKNAAFSLVNVNTNRTSERLFM